MGVFSSFLHVDVSIGTLNHAVLDLQHSRLFERIVEMPSLVGAFCPLGGHVAPNGEQLSH